MTHADNPTPADMPLVEPESILRFNDRAHVIHHGSGPGQVTLSRERFVTLCPETVIDKESLHMVEALNLHRAIDHTISTTGACALLRALVQPSTNLGRIQARQAALDEIASDDALRQALADVVSEYSRSEHALFRFLNKGLLALFPYGDFKAARKAAVTIGWMAHRLPRAASPYLNNLFDRLRAYRGSAVDRMMHGAMVMTLGGMKPADDVGFFTPKIRFVPGHVNKWMLAGPAVALSPLAVDRLGIALTISPLMMHIGLAWTGVHVLYSLFFKPIRDTDNFIDPFRVACIADDTFNRAIDAIGTIDALLSVDRFAREARHATVLPTVVDEDRHRFEAKCLRNPVMADTTPDFVPNDIALSGVCLSFLSGPNSGGKTTICKSIVHNQLLAQMGAHVMADSATIGIADMIRYQAPKFDELRDEEGRFGTEMARTRDIFFATGPRSLVILDELAEGTTVEERLHTSYDILSDFYTIGNNTVLVTHNHSLIDRFMDDHKGQCLMVEFDGERPTYRVIPGISRVSHAARVAEKIGFSKADRQRYLMKKGYR